MTQTLCHGSNFEIGKRDGVMVLAVVSRPEASLAEGANAAEDMFTALPRLLGEHTEVESVVWDLSTAPLAGPRTRRAMAASLESMAAYEIRVVVVVTHPTMKMLFRRLLGTHFPGRSAVAAGRAAARRWTESPERVVDRIERIDDTWALPQPGERPG